MRVSRLGLLAGMLCTIAAPLRSQQTQKPPLHARHWLAITGKPLGATAGALMFAKGGNAVDAACAMLGAGHHHVGRALVGRRDAGAHLPPEAQEGHRHRRARRRADRRDGGVLPFQGLSLPARIRPARGGHARHAGRPDDDARRVRDAVAGGGAGAGDSDGRRLSDRGGDGGLHRARQGRDQEVEVLAAPCFSRMPARRARRRRRARCSCRRTSPPRSRKLVEAERTALKAGKSRKQAIYAAYDRFYKGDIARELVRGVQEDGGLITLGDLANWKVRIEEPLSTTYKGITVYKLPIWQQGPVMLQALNILENADLKAMGYNSPKYIHTLYQTMNLAFADRDFYYGDPYFPPEEPVKGLLSKEYAKARYAQIDWTQNDSTVKPGDPYPYQGGTNPFASLLARLDAAYRRRTRSDEAGRQRLAPSTQSVLCGDDLDRGRGRGGVGRVGDAERRMDPGGDRGAHRRGPEPAGPELRDQGGGRAIQRDRAGQAPAGHAHADAGDEGRHTVPLLRRAGRRFAGSEPAPVVSRHRRVRDDAAAGGRGTEHQQLSDAIVVRRRTNPGPAGCWSPHPPRTVCAPRSRQMGYTLAVPGAHVGPDQRHHVRPRARHHVGCLEQPRRRLRIAW